jgi:hypothetical protein
MNSPEHIGETYGGDQVATSSGEVEEPTELNIAKATDAAIARIQETRKAGRPYNAADQILAVRLGAIFRRSGQLIRRRREPAMRRDEVVYVESGPVYDSLETAAGTPSREITRAGNHRDNRTTHNRGFPEGQLGRPLPDCSHNRTLAESSRSCSLDTSRIPCRQREEPHHGRQ